MESQLTFDMIKTVHILKRVIDEKISQTTDKSLTVPQAHVIRFIFNAKERQNIFQKDIEESFGLHRSSVSQMLNHMEKSGYIQRISVQEDARLKKIVLTDKAIAMQEEINRAIDQINTQLCNQISEEERATFINVLNKMRNSLK